MLGVQVEVIPPYRHDGFCACQTPWASIPQQGGSTAQGGATTSTHVCSQQTTELHVTACPKPNPIERAVWYETPYSRWWGEGWARGGGEVALLG